MNLASLEQLETSTSQISIFRNRTSGVTITVGERRLTIDDVARVARQGAKVRITDREDILQGVQASCDYISEAVSSGKPIYGVTSGFGGMGLPNSRVMKLPAPRRPPMPSVQSSVSVWRKPS